MLPLGVLAVASIAIPLTVVLAAVIVANTFVDNPAVFELDGNLTAGDAFAGGVTGTRDWADSSLSASGLGADVITQTAPEPGGVQTPGFPYLITDPAGVTIYTTGGSKDINDVSNWRYTSGSVPDKDEITHAFAAAYSVDTGTGTPHTWIYFGADRFADNGDSNIGFWFFQNAINLGGPPNANHATPFTGTPCPSGATNCLPGELHRNGDILIVSAFTQGGAVGSIIVFEWQNGSLVQTLTVNAAQCTPDSPSHSPACAIINSSPVPAPPAWQYVPKSGPANAYPTGSFFEGGIDVSALFGGQAPCFASFLAETRSSQTDNAQLKDFVLGSFPECHVSITKACTGASIGANPDGSNFIHYTFNGRVTNDGGGTLFDLNVVDTFPAGAASTVGPTLDANDNTGDPIANGLEAGNFVLYTGSFNFPSRNPVNSATVSAATTPGGAASVAPDHPGVWNPAAECPVAPNPRMTLEKGCVVGLEPVGGLLTIRVNETISVCNTSADGSQLTEVTVTDTQPTDPTTVFGPATLAAGTCQVVNRFYRPPVCANPDPANGVCRFEDTARVTRAVGPFGVGDISGSVLPALASCHLCPAGVCSTTTP